MCPRKKWFIFPLIQDYATTHFLWHFKPNSNARQSTIYLNLKQNIILIVPHDILHSSRMSLHLDNNNFYACWLRILAAARVASQFPTHFFWCQRTQRGWILPWVKIGDSRVSHAGFLHMYMHVDLHQKYPANSAKEAMPSLFSLPPTRHDWPNGQAPNSSC